MKLRNTSNYPKILEGTRFEPEEVKEVELDNEDLVSNNGSFEVVEDDDTKSSDEEDGKDGDTTEETSKPSNKKDEEGEE